MERLITLLAGLVVGLRGARREALEEVLDCLRIERVMWKDDLDYAQETVEKRERERDSALKDLSEERQETERLKRRIADLQGWNAALLGGGARGKWTLKVRCRILLDFKILSIKAVRIVSELGLKEAKEWVEAAPALNGAIPDPDITWITLSDNVDGQNLARALNTLLNEACSWNSPKPKPTCPQDVMFYPTEAK